MTENATTLSTHSKNPRAQAFYSKHGFRFDGHRKVDRDTGLWERRFVRR